MVTPEKRIQSPKTPPAPKTVPRSNILHDMAVRAQPVMWEVERQDRKRRKLDPTVVKGHLMRTGA